MVAPEMSDRTKRQRVRRRNREKRAYEPSNLERKVQSAIERARSQVGARVGEAIGHAAAEIERAAERGGEAIERATSGRGKALRKGRKPRQPKPEERSRAPDSGNVDLLWGLLQIHTREDGEERLQLLWGLLDITTRRPELGRRSWRRDREHDRGHDEGVGEDEKAPADPYLAAMRRTDQRIEYIRTTAIIGCLTVAFYYMSWHSAASFWQVLWGVVAILLTAITGGQVLGLFAEGMRQRWMERELNQTRARTDARRAVAGEHTIAMQELTASIAHEIRNPITAAKSLVQQMGEDPSAPGNVEYANVALQELDRVERSVSHLLRFARDEELERQVLELEEIIESAIAALDSRARQARIDVQRDFAVAGAISGDPEKLRRVFLNLIGNAIDALDESGTPGPRIRIQMGENLAGTEVWIRVSDNGPGIEPDRLPKIFSPFHTSKETGTGLGLPITKKLVEAHEGSIEVSSTLATGTEFLLTFPRAGAADS
jgi:signal transduction histidine kinase